MNTLFINKRSRGFTLIELLVVVSIIGLLASITMTSLNEARIRARDARRITDLQAIRTALELYRIKNGVYPLQKANPACSSWGCSRDTEWILGLVPDYMNKLPADPINNGKRPLINGGYEYAYVRSPGGNDYDLLAQFENKNNPNRCAVKCHTIHYYVEWNKLYDPDNKIGWCNPCPNSFGLSPYLYADH